MPEQTTKRPPPNQGVTRAHQCGRRNSRTRNGLITFKHRMKHIRPDLAAKLKSEKPTSEKARRLFEHWDGLGSERRGSCPALGVSRWCHHIRRQVILPRTGNDWGGIPRDTCFSNWRTFGLTKTLGRKTLRFNRG